MMMSSVSRPFYSCMRLARPTSRSCSRSLHYKVSCCNDDISKECDVNQFYQYTSGRWLWNETHQLARRYLEFDLPGLLQVSAQAIGARSCIKVEKLPEGNFNKVFLITVDDGRELIAKIPNPNAGPAHFTTASEAATIDYVRNILAIPAPQVYGWSSSADNPVRAEYILMERSRGIKLSRIWQDMPWEKRLEVVKSLVGYEKLFASADLPMYGSLYYAKDLPNPSASQFLEYTSSLEDRDTFAVGPTRNRAFFDQGRGSVEVDRGPWLPLDGYIRSRVTRELACVNKFTTYPGQQGFFNGPNQYRPTRDLKVRVLEEYLKVSSQIMPADTNLSKPTLWHSDLHSDNIFVDPSQPTKILNIIDWQAINISPLFLQARHPSLIEFDGPIPEGFKPIELPDDFEAMSDDVQLEAKNLRAAQSLYKIYELLTLQQSPTIGHALRFRDTLRGQITGLASSIFSDGEPILQGMLIQPQDEWAEVLGSSTPCPLSFTQEDKAQQQHLEASWCEGVELMHEILTEIGAYPGWEGWVNHDNYPVYKERLARCREEILERHAHNKAERNQWTQAWPFQNKIYP